MLEEIDLDGHIDAKGIRYLGKAKRQEDGKYICLADIGGALCRVEVTLTLVDRSEEETEHIKRVPLRAEPLDAANIKAWTTTITPQQQFIKSVVDGKVYCRECGEPFESHVVASPACPYGYRGMVWTCECGARNFKSAACNMCGARFDEAAVVFRRHVAVDERRGEDGDVIGDRVTVEIARNGSVKLYVEDKFVHGKAEERKYDWDWKVNPEAGLSLSNRGARELVEAIRDGLPYVPDEEERARTQAALRKAPT
jgi:hypothetical protein